MKLNPDNQEKLDELYVEEHDLSALLTEIENSANKLTIYMRHTHAQGISTGDDRYMCLEALQKVMLLGVRYVLKVAVEQLEEMGHSEQGTQKPN